jgi:hypothetical protein
LLRAKIVHRSFQDAPQRHARERNPETQHLHPYSVDLPNSLMAFPPTQNAERVMASSIHASPCKKAFQNNLVAAVMLLEEVGRKRR